MLEIKNVTKRFGNYTAVEDLSLTVRKGSVYGHNGELLVDPRAYDLDKDAFVDFLKKGIENFNNGVSIRNIYE